LQLVAPALDWYLPTSQAWQSVKLADVGVLVGLMTRGFAGSGDGLKDGLPAATEGERVALLGLDVGLRLVIFGATEGGKRSSQ
jgi:hypothetical protein